MFNNLFKSTPQKKVPTPKSNTSSCSSCQMEPVPISQQVGSGHPQVSSKSKCGMSPPKQIPQPSQIEKSNPAVYPTVDGSGIMSPCYRCDDACPNNCLITGDPWCPCKIKGTTTNPCLIKSRNYLQPWTEQPSYYLDMTQPFIGGRPVRQASHVNAIPKTMRYDTGNLMNRDFSCQQDCWGPSCI